MPVIVYEHLWYPVDDKNIKIKLPVEGEWGIPSKRWLFFEVGIPDPKRDAGYIYPAFPPTPDAPGLSIRCPFDGQELLNHMHIDGGLVCFGLHRTLRVMASRFCLEAAARMVHEILGVEHNYMMYKTIKEREEHAIEASSGALERLAEAFENVEVPKIKLDMGVTPDGFIKYIVSKKERER
jgi:hypothetical protein